MVQTASIEGESDGEPLPRKFDRYDLLKKLATGGMAEIYLAKQSGLEGFEKVVVLKRILGHLAQDEEFVSMFLDEARIAAKLSHPNIVQIYDLGKADGTYYIAMEYVSGRNVQHIIGKQQARGEAIPVEHVVRVCAGVCDGLYYAHSRKDYDGTPLNIVHRDISPQNILVSFAGGVKVVDFGIAKASTQLAQTRAGVLKGKYAYMSPEQVRGAKVDHRSDVFAVGLVMYEMLTGQRAFERDSSLKTLKAIVQEKPLNPRELNPEVPMEVVKLLSKALEKNPDRRYKSAQEMQLALEEYLESSPKKSNNVRLSRYMYDIFDDELNSKDGTMVVKGVGEVIIPASNGMKVEPREEEEIDHKTLSAALLPAAPGAASPTPGAPQPGARVVRNEDSGAAVAPAGKASSAPKPAAKDKTPPKFAVQPNATLERGDSAEEDTDGKTIPATDLDELEKKRAAMKARVSPVVAPPSRTDPGTDSSEDREDKTTAGVLPPGVSPEAARRAPNSSEDEKAAALLAKVEAMAAADVATRTAFPAAFGGKAPAGRDDPRATRAESGGDAPPRATQPELEALAPKESMIVGPNGRIDGVGGIRPPARPVMPSGPMMDVGTSDTPSRGLRAAEGTGEVPRAPSESRRPQRAQPASAKLPPYVYAAVIATAVLCISSVIGLVVILKAIPSSGSSGAIEYGVVTVTSDPPGATILIDGDAELTGKTDKPLQLPVPKDGDHVVEAKLAGHKDALQSFKFTDGLVVDVKITLKPE